MLIESKPVKILLIEDDPEDARLIQEMLAEVGEAFFDLECADRLSTGLERLTKGGIDVVLLDLGLPDSQGLETLNKVQAQAPEMPILALTGLADDTLGVEVIKKEAQDYLAKGQANSNLLARAMYYAIERKRAEEELKELLEQIERAKQEWESTVDSLIERRIWQSAASL